MRARTTAAALLGALAIVLPTAGATLAADHDDDDAAARSAAWSTSSRTTTRGAGDDEHRQIRPADNDTCYRLTGTSWENPATTVRNETESLAVLFRTATVASGRSGRWAGGAGERRPGPLGALQAGGR
ncbi:hypothetical protein ACFSNO_29135 [Streptomyces cirratus]